MTQNEFLQDLEAFLQEWHNDDPTVWVVPVVEAMAALVLADTALRQRCVKLDDMRDE